MKTKKVGTEVKARFREKTWGGSHNEFVQRFPTKETARKEARERGYEIVEMETVDKWAAVSGLGSLITIS